jgi:Rieske Fe-S protein
VHAELLDDRLVVSESAFRKEDGSLRHHVIVAHERLKYPIVVFTQADGGYRALWMSCTHRQAELNVSGDRLDCPVHGSEFDSEGRVISGPATEPLRSLPVDIREGRVLISLKA